MFSALKWAKKKNLKHLLKHLFRGGALICQKDNSKIIKNFKKLPRLTIKFDRLLKHAEDRFYEKNYNTNKLRNKGEMTIQH